MHQGLAARGLLPGLVATLSLLLPHSQGFRWWAIGGALVLFVLVAGLLAFSTHRYQGQSVLPTWAIVLEMLLGSSAICLSSIGGGGIEGNQRFFLILLVVISSSYHRAGLAVVGWLLANTALIVSALVVGLEPRFVLTLAINFAAVSAGVASVMVFFRRSLASANERTLDLAYLAAVSARAATIRAAVEEANETLCRTTGASRVVLASSMPAVPEPDDRWIELGETSRGPVFLAFLDTDGPSEIELAAISDIFRPVVSRDGVFADLQALSLTDSLSGLANRRGLDEYLAKHCVDSEDITWNDGQDAFGQLQDISVVLLDLDHFKRYNDKNGHLAGDQVLRDLGKLLREGVRGTDLAARYGGEEFCLVLAGDAMGTLAVVNRLRERWANMYPDVRFSAGIAFWDHKEDSQSLLARSDAALYESKERGRNRVTLAAGPPSTPQKRTRQPAL